MNIRGDYNYLDTTCIEGGVLAIAYDDCGKYIGEVLIWSRHIPDLKIESELKRISGQSKSFREFGMRAINLSDELRAVIQLRFNHER